MKLYHTSWQALKTTYFDTSQYIEVDIDVSADATAAYITGMVRGATSSLVIDLGESVARWRSGRSGTSRTRGCRGTEIDSVALDSPPPWCHSRSSPTLSLGFVLEGQYTWELPERLVGAARVSHLNVK